MKIWAELFSILSQSTRLTDEQTHGHTDRQTAISWLDRVACNACSAVITYLPVGVFRRRPYSYGTCKLAPFQATAQQPGRRTISQPHSNPSTTCSTPNKTLRLNQVDWSTIVKTEKIRWSTKSASLTRCISTKHCVSSYPGDVPWGTSVRGVIVAAADPAVQKIQTRCS